jgi:hypothetical protein
MLNDNRGIVRLSPANITLKKLENPMPCIKPNISAEAYRHFIDNDFDVAGVIMLMTATMRMEAAIRSSISLELAWIISTADKPRVKECPIVNAVARMRTFFQSFKV